MVMPWHLEEVLVNRIVVVVFCVIAAAQLALAQRADRAVPEINASSSATAISLISGALLVFRGRRKK